MANIPVHNLAVSETAPTRKGQYMPALISLGVLYFMMGSITCLNDTLVPFFKSRFTLTYSQSSLVQLYFFLTYGVMSIPAGKIVERIGYKNGMVTGFFIAAMGALMFYPASVFHEYFLFLGALFVIAIGIVLLQVAANPYIAVLGPSKTASSRLTLIQGIGSFGTTIAPIFGAYFILSKLQNKNVSNFALAFPYLGIALVLFLIALAISRLNLPVFKTVISKSNAAAAKKSIFIFRNLNLGILGIFVYVGAEVAIGTFLTNYISETLAIQIHDANAFVAFYWGGMMVGRLLGSVILKSIKPSVVLSICGGLAILLIILSVNTTGLFAVWTMIAVGLCNSVMFAIIFSLSIDGLGTHTAKASGLLSTAIAGGALISFAMGILKDSFDWKITFILPIACYVYIIFYGINGYRPKVAITEPAP